MQKQNIRWQIYLAEKETQAIVCELPIGWRREYATARNRER